MVDYYLIDPDKRYGPFVKSLLRGKQAGVLFDAYVSFPREVHRQEVKKKFWKKYGIDIDKPHRVLHINQEGM